MNEAKCPYCDSKFNNNAEVLNHVQKIHLGLIYSVKTDRVTAWCEDCEAVFDELSAANLHSDQRSHKVKIIEFTIWEGYR